METPVLNYASYKTRFFAFVIDFAILYIVLYFVNFLFSSFIGLRLVDQIIYFGFLCFVAVVILSLFEMSSLKSTPGKLLFKASVVDHFGNPCSYKKIISRNIVKIYTIIYFFLILFHFENTNNLFVFAIILSTSTNSIWHDLMTVLGGERHGHRLVHDQVAKTEVVYSK